MSILKKLSFLVALSIIWIGGKCFAKEDCCPLKKKTTAEEIGEAAGEAAGTVEKAAGDAADSVGKAADDLSKGAKKGYKKVQ